MTFGWHLGSFTKNTNTSGSNTTQDVTSGSITDTPKLVILWTSFTTADAAYQDANEVGFSLGFATTAATAGKMHSAGIFEDDGAASAVTRRWLVNNSGVLWMRKYSPSGTLTYDFYLNSFLSNGFRLTHVSNTNDTLSGIIYNYLVMWGSDITVNSGSFNARTTTGEDIIAHGLGAQPTFVMLLSGVNSTNDSNSSSAEIAIGMASSTTATNQVCMAVGSRNGVANMDTFRYMPTQKVIGTQTMTSNNGPIDAIGTLSAWDGTNFNVNWTDAPGLAWRVSWLAITGGKHDVHEMSAPASAGNQSKTGMTFQPEGLFAFSRGATATTTSDIHSLMSVGAAKSSSLHRNSLYSSEDGTANCEALIRSSNSYIIETNPTAIASTASSTAAPNMQIELVTFNSDGYTWNYDATTSGFITGVWSFAAAGSTAYSRTISEPAVSVSDSITRLLAAGRTISEPSVPVSDSLARSQGFSRTITETSVPVSDSISRLLAAQRTISEPSINVEDALNRSPGYNISISEAAVPVSDSIGKQLAAARSLADTVLLGLGNFGENFGINFGTTGDSIVAAYGLGRSMTEIVTVLGEGNFDDQNFDLQNFGMDDFLQVQLGAGRTITEASVGVSDSVSVSRGVSVSLSEPSIAVSDSISRLAAFQRAISEGAVAVSDFLSTGQNFVVNITEGAIAIADSIVAIASGGLLHRSKGSATSSKEPQEAKARKEPGSAESA